RRALRALFQADGRFGAVSAVGAGAAFLRNLDKAEPDVAVIGWDMPGLSGKEVLDRLSQRKVRLPTVVYTGSLNPEVPHQALAHGAAGFCSKLEKPDVLVETVVACAEGRLSFPYLDAARKARDPFAALTKRERELLTALSGGLSNAQIAARLAISLNTVKFHLKNLFDKLGVANRAQAVATFLKAGGG
ncbi:MAG: DNA-binding response regulator, partial [Alphaproteobacteria bacterium RIFOXYD12_FULL_60_8]